jgi:hypothetical protein
MWAALDNAGMPYTVHWGKINSLTPERMQRMYGASLDRFIAARARIVDNATLTAFSNKAFQDWGIDGRMAAGEVLV